MALLHLALGAAALWAAATNVQAEEPAPQGTEIRFVPATGSGTVSLGIYNREGLLVRVLCDEWTFNRFRIGLNGLSTTWDGRDGAGQPVPEGTYTARGFVVGDIGISGEAFHFNDWIDSPDSPPVVSVGAAQLLPGGDVLLAARLAGETGALIRYSPESAARWRMVVSGPRPQPARNVQLAASDKFAFVLLDGTLRAANLEDGTEVASGLPAGAVSAISARGGQLAVLDAQGLGFYAVPAFASQGNVAPLPAALVSIALLDNGTVAASVEGHLWLWQAGWSRLDVPEDIKIRQVHTGRDGTFWALEEKADGGLSVAQYSPVEGNLARWTPSADDGKIAWIAGAQDADYFIATLGSDQTQRTMAIRRREGGEGWEFVFDKKVTRDAQFGWSEGALVASGGELPQEVPVRLVENPLDPGASRNLVLRAATHESGPGIGTTDGLPLLRVSSQAGFRRVMLVPGDQENTARFFQGNEACVEEYSLTNLGDITSFDAGTIKMAGGVEEVSAAVDEEVQP
jgi:hypothetical protein